jgi:hypothetical protein
MSMQHETSAGASERQRRRVRPAWWLAVVAAMWTLVALACGSTASTGQTGGQATQDDAASTADFQTSQAVKQAVSLTETGVALTQTQVAAQAELDKAASAACNSATASPNAAAYKGSAPNKILVFDDSGTVAGALGSAWKATTLSEAQVAVCVKAQPQKVKTCKYHDGYSLTYHLPGVQIRLVSVRTGSLLFTQTFTSQSTCPPKYVFTDGVFSVDVDGDPPDIAVVTAWIQQKIHQ